MRIVTGYLAAVIRGLANAVRARYAGLTWIDVAGMSGSPVFDAPGRVRIGTVYAPVKADQEYLACSIHRPGIVLARTSMIEAIATLDRIDYHVRGEA